MNNSYSLPALPAATDPLASELYNQQHIDKDVRRILAGHLTAQLKDRVDARALVLGGRGGLVVEMLLPFCQQVDVVEEEGFAELLEERFVKRREVDYFFGKEGNIGTRHTLPAPAMTDQTVRVIRIPQLQQLLAPSYDLILVQNDISGTAGSLIPDLLGVQHAFLSTMMVPGKITDPRLFQFYARFQLQFIGRFYQGLLHERVQNRRFITGRREEIIYYEVFVWKRNGEAVDAAQVHSILALPALAPLPQGEGNPYETRQMVDTYLGFHFGEDHFGIENYPLKCAQICIEEARKQKIAGRALDLGCSVGRSTLQLAAHFEEVVGLDYSKAFIDAAQEVLKEKHSSLEGRVKFVVGDACNLDPALGKFNLIFGGNLIDRLPDPAAFVTSVAAFLAPGALLILTSPYSWLAQYTAPSKWLGGIIEKGEQISTEQGLRRLLQPSGIRPARGSENIRFVIKINEWVYEYTLANATYWLTP